MELKIGNTTINDRSVIINTAGDRLALQLGQLLIRAENLADRNAQLEAELPALRAETDRLKALLEPQAAAETAAPGEGEPGASA